MDDMFAKVMEFVLSRTMRNYLSQLHSEGKLTLSGEDMVSIVYHSPRSFKERFELIPQLAELVEDKEAHRQLCKAAELLLSDFSEKGLYLLAREEIYDEDDEDNYEPIAVKETEFNSFEEAAAYAAASESGYLCCRLCCGNEEVVREVGISDNDISYLRTTPCDEDCVCLEPNAADRMMNRYVYLPNPFKAGDVVCMSDAPEERYIIIVATPDDPDKIPLRLDYIDTSVMVVPAEFKQYTDPEVIRLRYERLFEAGRNGEDFPLDDIAIHHEHIPVLLLEFAEKN